ncbi:MAG: roadblock/LC7 domain-containing protein [Myxococcota bacterium]
MTFRQILEKIVNDTPGALAGAIMAADGIPVDEYGRSAERVDLASMAVEFQRVLEQARKVSGTIYEGRTPVLQELILITSGHQLLFRQIDDEFFVTVALTPLGSLGKARYLVRSLLDDLRREL